MSMFVFSVAMEMQSVKEDVIFSFLCRFIIVPLLLSAFVVGSGSEGSLLDQIQTVDQTDPSVNHGREILLNHLFISCFCFFSQPFTSP